jgi:hypothetical protein
MRRLGNLQFAFNYAPLDADISGLVPSDAALLLGELTLPPAGVAAWEVA